MFFRCSLLCLAINATFPLSTQAAENTSTQSIKPETEEQIEFSEQFLLSMGSTVDVNRCAQGNPAPPGIYRVKISLNGINTVTQEVEFRDNGTFRAAPCITAQLFKQAGINIKAVPDDSMGKSTCVDVKTIYPSSSVNFDSSKLVLELTVPQLYVLKRPPSYVDPSLWDAGIPAALLSHNINSWHRETDGYITDTTYAGLQYGLNSGAWHLRSRGTLDWDSGNGTSYTSQDIYLQRDIPVLSTQLMAGETYTDDDAFGSVSVRGMRLYSDNRVRPEGTTSYSPVIRGVANSNAKVNVEQSGRKIYEATAPPGPFELNDLSTTGFGNDLEVTVEESDGSKHTFVVPYSSVTQMVRPGAACWEFGTGKLNNDSLYDAPQVGYATGYYGINSTFTGYAGVQFTDMDFYAGLSGVAMNTRVGAFALDVTHSQADIENLGSLSGQSYRLTYSKMIEATDTSFSIVAYRFSTKDYLSLSDAAQLNDNIKYGRDDRSIYDSGEVLYSNYQRTKNQYQVNINQPLDLYGGSYGPFYASGSWEDYWNNSGNTSGYNTGYSNSSRYDSYSLSVQRSYDEEGERDDNIYFSISVPLNVFSNDGKGVAGFNASNMSVNSDTKGSASINNSASGSARNGLLNYFISTANNINNDDSNLNQVSGYGSWRSPYGPLSVSSSFSDDDNRQYSAGYNDGMVLHSDGVTLLPSSLDNNSPIILVHASGARGAKLGYGQGKLNSSGYALMPYASAHRENHMGLNISTLERDVEVKNTSENVVSRDDAVVKAKFATDEGRSAILGLLRDDKGFIPLGAGVLSEKGKRVDVVGQTGQAYVRGVEEKDNLRVVRGNEVDSDCAIHYRITGSTLKAGLTIVLNGQRCHMQ